MPVGYIRPRSRPTAKQMNSLFEKLDGKMAAMLAGGKSFLLAQDSPVPNRMMGKVFYFTSGTTYYAQRAPGPQESGVPVNYDHSIFTAAVAAIVTGDVIWDETLKIANAPRIGPTPGVGTWMPSSGPGRYVENSMGVFEHSLAAHYLLHQGESDAVPVRYYIRDGNEDTIPEASTSRGLPPPEKHLLRGLAEIVMEGVTSVTIEAAWDKYGCFRVHNLNGEEATVEFAATGAEDGYTLTVPAFGCETVRRDLKLGPDADEAWIANNYRRGWHYFLKFVVGDWRMGWFYPTDGAKENIEQPWWDLAAALGAAPGDGRAANSMSANNLANPVGLVHDWVNFLAVDKDDPSAAVSGIPLPWGAYQTARRARAWAVWLRDMSVVADAYADGYGKLWGDPNDEATNLGDLLHHKGKLKIIRTSRTEMETSGPHAGRPKVTAIEDLEFRGYETIVEDFAAKQLEVTENFDGDYQIRNVDGASWVDLISVSTNLLKRGETIPVRVGLNDGSTPEPLVTVESPYVIEHAVIEAQSVFLGVLYASDNAVLDPELAEQVEQQSIYGRQHVATANTRDFQEYPGGVSTPVVVTGPDRESAPIDLFEVSDIIHGIHAVTVEDLVAFKFWKGPSVSNPDRTGAYVKFTQRKVWLTPEGVALTFREETQTLLPPTPALEPNVPWGPLAAERWKQNRHPVMRVIKFRGHGWGYISPSKGGHTSGHWSPHLGLPRVNDGHDVYPGSVDGERGADFGVSLGHKKTAAKLRRLQVKYDEMTLHINGGAPGGGRFWRPLMDGTNLFLEKFATPAGYEDLQNHTGVFGLLAANALNDAAHGFYSGDLKESMLPLGWEQYNLCASLVNSIVSGYPLTAACLLWPASSGGDPLHVQPTSEGMPVPMECFASFGNGSDQEALYGDLGITIYGVADFPDTLEDKVVTPQGASVYQIGRAGITCETVTMGIGGDPQAYNADFRATISLAVEYLDSDKLAKGEAVGSECVGTFTPGVSFTEPATGKYLVAESTGYDTYIGQLIFAGDIYIGTDFARNEFGGYASGRVALPGDVLMPFLPTGWTPSRWVRIAPTFAEDGTAAVTSLGNWTASGTLPADGTDKGDYYNIAGDYVPGGGGTEYHDGDRLVWNGSEWKQAHYAYSNFHWVKIQDVKEWAEALGFPLQFNELVVPLKLEYVSGAVSTALSGGVASADTVISGGGTTVGPGSGDAATVKHAINASTPYYPNNAGLSCQLEIVNPLAGGARWQFAPETPTTDIPSGYAPWKFRQAIPDVTLDYETTRVFGNCKCWDDVAGAFLSVRVLSLSALAVDQFFGATSEGITFFGDATFAAHVQIGAQTPAWDTMLDVSGLTCPVYQGLKLEVPDESLRGPVQEDSFWANLWWAVKTSDDNFVQIAVVARDGWGPDGDWWAGGGDRIAQEISFGPYPGGPIPTKRNYDYAPDPMLVLSIAELTVLMYGGGPRAVDPGGNGVFGFVLVDKNLAQVKLHAI